MADKDTFQKEMGDRLKEWSKIINELRAEGEEKLISHSKDFKAFCAKGIMIHNNYLGARQKLEELAKVDEAMWEKHASDIEGIMKELDHLWEKF
jgi:hypothetical protein